MEENKQTEAGVVADLATHNAMLMQSVDIRRTVPNGSPFVVLANGEGGQQVCSLAQYEPPRKQGAAVFTEADGFTDYVSIFGDDRTRVFCDVDRRTFTAILDYHDPAAADHEGRRGLHTASLTLRLTPTMEAWLKLAQSPITQAALAEFLEDRYRDIAEPAGADILELAKTLEVKNDVAFKSAQRVTDGGYDLLYQETVAARAGQAGSLTIPTKFLLRIAMFQGAATSLDLAMRLRFSLVNGTVVFRVAFLGLEDAIREEVERVREVIRAESGFPVWAGTARLG